MAEQDVNMQLDKVVKKIKEEGGGLGEILSSLNNTVMDDGFSVLASLLTLDDEQFEVIAPTFLHEITRQLEDPNNMHETFLQIQASGSSPDEFVKQMEQSILTLEEIEDPLFTRKKKDFFKSLFTTMSNSLSSYSEINSIKIFVDVEKLEEDINLPAYAHLGDAGLDIYSTGEYTIDPGETVLIKTGIKVALPAGYELQVRDKSGVALKTKLRVANAPGTIDSNYREEIGVIVENIEPKYRDLDLIEEFDNEGNPKGYSIQSVEYGRSFTIEKGQKIAQLVLNKIPTVVWNEVEKVSEIEDNRTGGFGSTGLF